MASPGSARSIHTPVDAEPSVIRTKAFLPYLKITGGILGVYSVSFAAAYLYEIVPRLLVFLVERVEK